jgi:hypothetical protein
MAQRDNSHFDWVLGMHPSPAGPPGRCPVQPSTPLGPDQVNVIIIIIIIRQLRRISSGGEDVRQAHS